MIVCNCNALNERKVDEAIEAGAKCWREVQAFHGCVPDCGSCEQEITDRLSGTDLDTMPGKQEPPSSVGFLVAAE